MLVDVAGFDVAYFRDNEPIWTSKVVVGRPYRETPVFKSEITYVVLNPTWTIPPGILAKDTLPAVKRDPGYLARHRIRVIDAQWPRSAAVVGRLEPLPHLHTLSVAAGPGPRQLARARQDHVPEPVSRLPARFAGEIALRPRRAGLQLGMHSGGRGRSSSPSSCSTILRNGTPQRSRRLSPAARRARSTWQSRFPC